MNALEPIWADLATRVRRYVGRRINDVHAAEDVTQDVLLKVGARLDAPPDGDTLPAWVFAAARNAVIDHYRARAVRDHADLAEHEEVAGDDEAERRDAVAELTPCLLRMVEQLPEPYRTAMKLADIEGLPQQEVADRGGLSLSGAKSQVQRGRKMLREMILDCCNIERDARGNVMDYETTARSSRYCGLTDEGRPKCEDGN
jgi:RNA polymerase sigma-70 factor, ECF subfamily